MNLKTAVASALLGTLATGGASAGVIQTLAKRDNPVVTFDAAAPALGVPPVPQASVSAETPVGTVGVSNAGGEVAVTVPVPGVGTGTGSAAVTVPGTSAAKPSRSTPPVTVNGGLVLPGLDIAGLGDILKTVSSLDLARVAGLLNQLPVNVYPVLGRVLDVTAANDMDELLALLHSLTPAQAAQVLGVLNVLPSQGVAAVGGLMKNTSAVPLGQITGLFGSLPVDAAGTLESLLATLDVAQLDAVGNLFVKTPAGEMSATGNALVQPNLVTGLLGGVLSTLNVSNLTKGLLTQVTGVIPSKATTTLVGRLMTTLEPATVSSLGTAFGLIPKGQLALVNQMLAVVPVEHLGLVSDMLGSLGVEKTPVVGSAFSALSVAALTPLAELLGFVPAGLPLPVVAELFEAIL